MLVESSNDPPKPANVPRQRDVISSLTRFLVGTGTSAAVKTTQGLSRAAGSATKSIAGAVGSTAKATATAASQSAKSTVSGARQLNLWWLVALGVRGLFLPVLVLTYVVVSAEGIRTLFDGLATPIHQLWPAVGQWKELRRVDVAQVLAMVLLIFVWLAWEKVVGIYLDPPEHLWNEEKLIWSVGGGLLLLDGILFFIGIKASGGFLVSETATFWGACVMTGLYLLMLIFAAYLIVKITRHTKESRS